MNTRVEEAHSVMWSELHVELSRAYQTMFMWATLDDDVRAKARAMVLKRFVAADDQMRGWLSHSPGHPAKLGPESLEVLKAEVEALRREQDEGSDPS